MASQNPCGFKHCSYSTFAFVHSSIFSVRCLKLLESYASNVHMHHIPASCTRLHLPFKNVNRGRVSLLPIISRSLTIFEDATTKNKLQNRERTHDLDQASGFSLCLLVTNAKRNSEDHPTLPKLQARGLVSVSVRRYMSTQLKFR